MISIIEGNPHIITIQLNLYHGIIIIITLFKVDKNTNVIQVTSNKIAAISIESAN